MGTLKRVGTAVLLVAGTLIGGGPARADEVTPTAGLTLPYRTYGGTGGSDGQSIYMFGGIDCNASCEPTDKILRFSPSQNTVETLSVRLPSPRWLSSSVWTGTEFLIFGGNSSAGGQILSFVPATSTLSVIPTTIPGGRLGAAAIWDGTAAYLFGGALPGGGDLDSILRFDPATQVLTTRGPKLPKPGAGAAAVWTGSAAYLFGGSGSRGIVRYDPATDSLSVMASTLPHSRYYSTAAWSGTTAYIVGGCCDPTTQFGSQVILSYDPSLDLLREEEMRFPVRLYHAFGGVADGTVYLLGGSGWGSTSNEVFGFDMPSKEVLSLNGLPLGMTQSAGALSNAQVWMAGGRDNEGNVLDRAVLVDPYSVRSRIKSARMTVGRYGSASTFDGRYLYLFGGQGPSSKLDEIIRYDTVGNSFETLGARLPSPRRFASAVWDGTRSYIFGGEGSSGYSLDEIVAYDHATDTAQILSAKLPTQRSSTAAVWDGARALVFSGSSGVRQVVAFDPATGVVSIETDSLPNPAVGAGAIFHGGNAYLFGGGLGDEIFRYSPARLEAVTMSARLPSSLTGALAIWAGTDAFILGGCCSGGIVARQILRYDLLPGPPTVTGLRGPRRGEVTINWLPPASNTHSSPTLNYRVYVGSSAGGEALTAVLPPDARSYSVLGLADGAVRYLRVSAIDSRGEGKLSGSIQVRAPVLPSSPLSPRTITGPGVGQIKISWDQPSEPGGVPLTYNVYGSGSPTGTKSLILSTTSLTATESGLANGVTRYYQISAVNVVGESPWSVQTSGKSPATPSAPRFLQSQVLLQGVSLTWVSPLFNGGLPVTSYRLYRTTPLMPRTKIADFDQYTTYYLDSRCFGLCIYDVTAVNLVGESPISNTANGIGLNPF